MPDILTKEIIDALKEKYPSLYRIRLGSQDFVFRPITRREWLQIQDLIRRNPNMTPNDVDDRIVEYGLVWPEWTIVDFMNQPAGYTAQLSRYIQARSGFLVPGINEDMPGVEVLSENSAAWIPPDKEFIERLKAQRPGGLLLIRIRSMVFVVRPLNRAEWRAIAKEVENGNVDVDSAVFERAVIYPDAETLKAIDTLPGVVTLVSNEVIRFSGFDESEEVYVEEL